LQKTNHVFENSNVFKRKLNYRRTMAGSADDVGPGNNGSVFDSSIETY
jgi:hypothetical protein